MRNYVTKQECVLLKRIQDRAFQECAGKNRRQNMIEIPIWEKSNLTIEEAAVYSGIGRNKLRELTESETCTFVLWIGTKRLIKRRKFDEFIDKAYSV